MDQSSQNVNICNLVPLFYNSWYQKVVYVAGNLGGNYIHCDYICDNEWIKEICALLTWFSGDVEFRITPTGRWSLNTTAAGSMREREAPRHL